MLPWCGKGGSGQAGRLHGGGRRCAPTALRFSRPRPGAELASFASLTAFGQLRRVRPRSALRALPRALRCSAPPSRVPACPNPPLLRQWWCLPREEMSLPRARRCNTHAAHLLGQPPSPKAQAARITSVRCARDDRLIARHSRNRDRPRDAGSAGRVVSGRRPECSVPRCRPTAPCTGASACGDLRRVPAQPSREEAP